MSEEKLDIAKKLSLLKDENCHWKDCKCVENNIKLRTEIIKLKRYCKEIIKEKQELTTALENSICKENIREKINDEIGLFINDFNIIIDSLYNSDLRITKADEYYKSLRLIKNFLEDIYYDE